MRIGFVILLPLVLAACLGRAPEATAPAASPEAEIAVAIEKETAKSERRGFLGGLFKRKPAETDADPVIQLSEVAVAPAPTNEEISDVVETQVALAEAPVEDTVEGPAKPRRGLFSLFRKRPPAEDVLDETPAQTAPLEQAVASAELVEPEKLATAQEKATQEEVVQVKTARVGGGFFGLFKRKPVKEGPEEVLMDPALLPEIDEPIGGDPTPLDTSFTPGFGTVQTVCEAKRRKFGKEVDGWPEDGRRTFRLFDSDPSSSGVRDFYLIGFKDKCPRRFRASIVFFGSPELYETVRLDRHNRAIPITATDKAYDKLKRRICGKGPKKPCGAKMSVMEKSTVFVTAYDNFGSTSRWAEFLLHNRSLVEVSLKQR